MGKICLKISELWYTCITAHHSCNFSSLEKVVRTFKVHFLTYFQVWNTVLLTIVTVLYIESCYLLILDWNFISSVPLPSLISSFAHPHPPPSATTNLFSIFMLSFSFLLLVFCLFCLGDFFRLHI